MPPQRQHALTLLLSLLLSLLLASPLTTVTAASADTTWQAIDLATSGVISVHKFDQPEKFGEPASGELQNTAGLTPVSGATFTAKRVPGIDSTTDQGREAASRLSLADALQKTASEPVESTSTTDAHGDAVLEQLPLGLYVVDETVTPDGFASSDPFLVMLPFSGPSTGGPWLTTVHVYPKNASASAALSVDDAEAVTLGDYVRWTSHTTVPRRALLSMYRVMNTVADGLEPPAAGDVAVTLSDGTQLSAGDYACTMLSASISVEFTESGRVKLAAARERDPSVTVDVSYRTRVLSVGEHVNEVNLQIAQSAGLHTGRLYASAATKWGEIRVFTHERNHPENLISGAKFELYRSAEDALTGRNAINLEGQHEWTSDADGNLVMDGVRLSNFVNGLDRDSSDPLFRTYYVMPTSFPAGWTGEKTPVGVVVNSVTDTQVVTVVLWRTDETGGDTGGGDSGIPGSTGLPSLALTGAQLTGLLLLALVLVGGGALALTRRRSRSCGDSNQNGDSPSGDSQTCDASKHE